MIFIVWWNIGVLCNHFVYVVSLMQKKVIINIIFIIIFFSCFSNFWDHLQSKIIYPIPLSNFSPALHFIEKPINWFHGMTGFYMKCNTGLKRVKNTCYKNVRSLAFWCNWLYLQGFHVAMKCLCCHVVIIKMWHTPRVTCPFSFLPYIEIFMTLKFLSFLSFL